MDCRSCGRPKLFCRSDEAIPSTHSLSRPPHPPVSQAQETHQTRLISERMGWQQRRSSIGWWWWASKARHAATAAAAGGGRREREQKRFRHLQKPPLPQPLRRFDPLLWQQPLGQIGNSDQRYSPSAPQIWGSSPTSNLVWANLTARGSGILGDTTKPRRVTSLLHLIATQCFNTKPSVLRYLPRLPCHACRALPCLFPRPQRKARQGKARGATATATANGTKKPTVLASAAGYCCTALLC